MRTLNGTRAIVTVLGLLSCLLAPTLHAAPRLSVPTVRHEIAELTGGETAEVEFPLENTGTEPLQIREVVLSCGCITTSYPASLKPGEKGVLKVTLNSEPLWDGPVEKRITIVSNDPEQPERRLLLTANMRPLLRFMPANPLTITYQQGERIRQVVVVTSTAYPAVTITGVTPNGIGTQARMLPAESTDKPGLARIELTIRPPAHGGDFVSAVILETSHPKVPLVPLRIHAISKQGVTVSPSIVYLSGLGRDPSALPNLVAIFKRQGGFHVLEVKTDNPALQAEIAESSSNEKGGEINYYQIRLRYLGGWQKGKATGMITVTTDDAQSPTLEVPYEATVE